MKVFLSWSGQRSKLVAELLNDWLRCVLQAVRPWISSRDIDRGALWFGEISEQLGDTGIGIVCLTAENKTKPWILFEAGALAKGLSHSRVCTLLVDLTPTDVEDPLAQFNHTLPERESMWALVRTLNNMLQTNALDDRILQNVFDTYWPQFEEGFAKVIADTPQVTVVTRSDDSLLKEVLSTTRSLASRMRSIEKRLPGSLSDEAPTTFGARASAAEFVRESGTHGVRGALNALSELAGIPSGQAESEHALARLASGEK